MHNLDLKTIDASKPIGDIDFLPYFCYNPIYKDKDTENQENVYIFQAFTAYLPLSCSKNIINLQKIFPCKAICVKNKKIMLETLEKIDITKTFIYSNDNAIAEEVNSKIVAEYLLNNDN